MAKYPRYVGYDVSKLAVDGCRQLFGADPSKRFALVDDYRENETADLVLSLDVIFHLVEQPVFEAYMQRLFAASGRFVAIYCSNQERSPTPAAPHVRHRRFTTWVESNATDFVLLEKRDNPFRHGRKTREGHTSPSDFYFCQRSSI